MPRTLVELSRAMPDVRLIPHAVTPAGFESQTWWLSPLAMRNLVAEYVKFLPSAARLALQLAVTPFESGPVATANGNIDRKT
jgi:hypothetical protein